MKLLRYKPSKTDLEKFRLTDHQSSIEDMLGPGHTKGYTSYYSKCTCYDCNALRYGHKTITNEELEFETTDYGSDEYNDRKLNELSKDTAKGKSVLTSDHFREFLRTDEPY
jgi:hypothetical protein